MEQFYNFDFVWNQVLNIFTLFFFEKISMFHPFWLHYQVSSEVVVSGICFRSLGKSQTWKSSAGIVRIYVMYTAMYIQKYLLQGGGNSNIFWNFTQHPRKMIPHLRSVFFQMGWNHQLVTVYMQLICLYNYTVIHVCNVFELNMISYGVYRRVSWANISMISEILGNSRIDMGELWTHSKILLWLSIFLKFGHHNTFLRHTM